MACHTRRTQEEAGLRLRDLAGLGFEPLGFAVAALMQEKAIVPRAREATARGARNRIDMIFQGAGRSRATPRSEESPPALRDKEPELKELTEGFDLDSCSSSVQSVASPLSVRAARCVSSAADHTCKTLPDRLDLDSLAEDIRPAASDENKALHNERRHSTRSMHPSHASPTRSSSSTANIQVRRMTTRTLPGLSGTPRISEYHQQEVKVLEPGQQAESATTGESRLVKFEVLEWSSQRDLARHAALNLADGQGACWEAVGEPDHWIILDLGTERRITTLEIRCTGAETDPASFTVMRAADMKAALSRDESISPATLFGPWIVVRRGCINSGPRASSKQKHKIKTSEVRSRYLKLIFHSTHHPAGQLRIAAPLRIFAKDETAKALAAADGLVLTPNLERTPSLTTIFCEEFNLSKGEREMRRVARLHNIPLAHAELVQDTFRRFDSTGSGSLSFNDFTLAVRALMHGGQGSQLDATRTTPGSTSPSDWRFRSLWQAVDADGSGKLELEEFLLWYCNAFPSADDSRMSFHGSKRASSAQERYYANLGQNRLRSFAAGRNL